jgi:type VI protein secretion system component VasF
VQNEIQTVSSSDSNAREDLWARHYQAAAQRRRARGWHRWRESRTRHTPTRLKVYLVAASIFVALTVVALLLPR